MELARWVIFLVAGKIVIHVLMNFRLPKGLKKREWIVGLQECDLCMGVWVYSILSFFTEVDLLEATGFGYVPIVGAIVTGIVMSWMVHIFSLGWKSKYEVVVV